MNNSISSAAMSVDSDGVFGTSDAEIEQTTPRFSKTMGGFGSPSFLDNKKRWCRWPKVKAVQCASVSN
jgi:hypothetical protein